MLGPQLFVTYANDEAINVDGLVSSFADDTKMLELQTGEHCEI